jgi:hypothetical protein
MLLLLLLLMPLSLFFSFFFFSSSSCLLFQYLRQVKMLFSIHLSSPCPPSFILPLLSFFRHLLSNNSVIWHYFLPGCGTMTFRTNRPPPKQYFSSRPPSFRDVLISPFCFFPSSSYSFYPQV